MTQLADNRRSIDGTVFAVAPLTGLAIYLLMIGLTQQTHSLGDWLLDLAAGGATAAVAGTIAWRMIRSGEPTHISRAALGLAVLGLLSLPVTYYLGVPEVFGATAVALGAAARTTSGRWTTSSAAATAFGLLAVCLGAASLAAGW